VIVDRDNNSIPGENGEDENLLPAWAKDENHGLGKAVKLGSRNAISVAEHHDRGDGDIARLPSGVGRARGGSGV
jgi:hypothetical protein